MQLIHDKARGPSGEADRSDPIDVYVGKRLQLARVAMGWSQGGLADRLEISAQQVGDYEAGRDQIGAGRLYRLAGLFDISVQYFFDGMTPQRAASPGLAAGRAMEKGEGRSQNRALHVLTAYQELRDPELREALDDLLTAMRRSLALERARARPRPLD